MEAQLVEQGRQIVDANAYLTLATADDVGLPWASPVWFAHDAYRRFLWVSRPTARHSRNIGARPEVGMVIFDSTVPDGQGQGVYLEAVARPADDDELDACMSVFSARSVARGSEAWTAADVTKPDGLRLYVADATAHWVLDDHDQRIPVEL